MSVAGVSLARVTIAEVDLRSAGDGPDWLLGRIRTLSTVMDEVGMSDLMKVGEVPGGSEERCNVGFGAAFSAEVLWSSSSSVRNAAAAS